MEHVGGLDSAFLSCETPTMHMHVCGLLVLDVTGMAADEPYRRLRDLLEARMPQIAPMRRRLVPVPFNVARPLWTDAEVDVEAHLRRVVLEPPADDRALARLAGEFAGTQLSRDRPLWEMLLIEGLPDNKVALLVKMHHSTIDGISGANLMGELFSLDPSGRPGTPSPPVPPDRIPGPAELLGRAVLDRFTQPVEAAKLLPATVARVGSALWQGAKGDLQVTMPFTAPRTSFNASVTARRAVAFTSVPLADVKAVKLAHHVTVNDVLTAVVGTALRHYLEERGELPDRSLIAAEPVSVHEQARGIAGNTKVSVMFTSLCTDVVDPVERLQAIAESNARAKEFHSMVGAETLLGWAEHFSFNGFALGARIYSRLHGADHHPVIHNLILSNVPGPPIPLFLAGARLVGIYPLGPVLDGAGLNVTVLSQEDRVGFGIIACGDLVPDPWKIAAAIPVALDQLIGSLKPGRKHPSHQG
ncbi:MAG: WS/DGAT/MGAT family O-acyltransferase [Acidimicrobiales bacterium]